MLDFINSSASIGVSLQNSHLSFARVMLVKGSPKITELFKIPYSPEEENVKQFYMEKIQNEDIVCTGLRGYEVLIRPLEIKLGKDKDVSAVYEFQTEPILPFPAENALIEKIKISNTKETTLLTIAAIKKDHLKKHLEAFEEFSITPEIVSCDPVALAAFAQFIFPEKKSLLIVHLSMESIICVQIREGKLVSAHTSQLTSESTQENIFFNIQKAIFAFSKGTKNEVEEILLCGDYPEWEIFSKELKEKIMKTFVVIPEGISENFDRNEIGKYALPIGLALSGLSINSNCIDFRKKELSFPHPWKRYQKPLTQYFGLVAFLSFSLYLFGSTYIDFKHDELKNKYVQLLEAMNKTYEITEKEFSPKNMENGEEIIPLANFTQEDIQNRLEFLQKELNINPNVFPLHPNVPKVSDLFAWLAIHPKIVSTNESGEKEALLHIESLNYVMVKRPEQNKKQEKYQVKVDIEFSSSTPKLAREFHDALIEPNEIVDPKGEIKWNSSRGKYRTSFYLKDKTQYMGA